MSQSHSRLPGVQMALAGTTYVGQILHSAHVSSIVAWGHPDHIQSGVFISFHAEVFIFKTISPTGTKLFLVLHGSEHGESVSIDLKENILTQDSTRPNVLTCMKAAPSAGVRITFPDVESAEDFEIWMHAALLEVAAEEDGISMSRLVELLTRPEGLEYDGEHDVFPGLERLAEELDSESLDA